MPRRPAADRHRDSAPNDRRAEWPPEGDDLVEALIAAQHPVRRRLYEALLTSGPASVGALAERIGLQPGSVSHHLKPLHRAGFVEPAPELARDTRESWWRAIRRQLSWSTDAWPAGTLARQVADQAERANLAHQTDTVARWMRGRESLPAAWRGIGLSTDHLVAATREQHQALEDRVMATIRAWEDECRADAVARPDADRRTVRVLARIFPDVP